jgi:phage-related protein
VGNPKIKRVLIYLGSTQKDASKLPEEVQRLFVAALRMALVGGEHEDAKPMKGFGGRSVLEVVADHRGDTYREMYTTRFEETIYVLHIFQKKSKRGIKTPKEDIELIKKRLKFAENHHKDMYEKKKTAKK